jgi:hypothetical protein
MTSTRCSGSSRYAREASRMPHIPPAPGNWIRRVQASVFSEGHASVHCAPDRASGGARDGNRRRRAGRALVTSRPRASSRRTRGERGTPRRLAPRAPPPPALPLLAFRHHTWARCGVRKLGVGRRGARVRGRLRARRARARVTRARRTRRATLTRESRASAIVGREPARAAPPAP